MLSFGLLICGIRKDVNIPDLLSTLCPLFDLPSPASYFSDTTSSAWYRNYKPIFAIIRFQIFSD